MDPRRFYGITRSKEKNGVLAFPQDSEDEYLSDEDEYQLPKITVEESESDSEVDSDPIIILCGIVNRNTIY